MRPLLFLRFLHHYRTRTWRAWNGGIRKRRVIFHVKLFWAAWRFFKVHDGDREAMRRTLTEILTKLRAA